MPAVLNFDSFPLWKSKRRGNAAVSSRAGAEIKNAAPMIYINDFFATTTRHFLGFSPEKIRIIRTINAPAALGNFTEQTGGKGETLTGTSGW